MTTAQANPVTTIGVGIDTSRYGHYVSFLRDDLQPATEPLTMTETREGYDKLLSTLRELSRRYANVEFQIRLDEAGQYAANLKTFLYALPFEKTVSIGDCVRNKNYRVAHFPKRKSDSVDSLSVARYAVREQPQAAEKIPLQLGALRDVASRLEAQAREVTRHVNQLHNVLARRLSGIRYDRAGPGRPQRPGAAPQVSYASSSGASSADLHRSHSPLEGQNGPPPSRSREDQHRLADGTGRRDDRPHGG